MKTFPFLLLLCTVPAHADSPEAAKYSDKDRAALTRLVKVSTTPDPIYSTWKAVVDQAIEDAIKKRMAKK